MSSAAVKACLFSLLYKNPSLQPILAFLVKGLDSDRLQASGSVRSLAAGRVGEGPRSLKVSSFPGEKSCQRDTAGPGQTSPTRRPPGGGVILALEIRGAAPDDLPAVREVIAASWADPEDEPALWDYIAARHTSFTPEGVRVVVLDGRIVATATVLRCRFQTPRGWVPGAEVTLVACHPEFRRRGYGSAAFRDALAYMADQRLALTVFYGDPAFYGPLGCAPVLPGLGTYLEVHPVAGPDLRPATADDHTAIAALYTAGLAVYPCAPHRTDNHDLWRVRNEKLHALLVLPDRTGYAFVSDVRDKGLLLVREAAASGKGPARRLLEGLVREAERRGLARLRLALPPDHAVAKLALTLGGRHVYRAPAQGLAAVTLWKSLLPEGYEVVLAAGGSDTVGLARDGRLVLKAGRRALTGLVAGYRPVADLLLDGSAELVEPEDTAAAREDLAHLERRFRAGYPRYFEAPFYFWL